VQLFFESLTASGPHPSLGAHAVTYGRVIGSWAGEFNAYPVGRDIVSTSAEVHFAWALDGRAVQDVWITPSRKDRAAGVRAAVQMYGTTLRMARARFEHRRGELGLAGRIQIASSELTATRTLNRLRSGNRETL